MSCPTFARLNFVMSQGAGRWGGRGSLALDAHGKSLELGVARSGRSKLATIHSRHGPGFVPGIHVLVRQLIEKHVYGPGQARP